MFKSLVLSGVVAAALVGTALAQPQMGRPVAAPMAQKERMAQKLNLSAEQKAKMHKIRADLERKQIPVQSKIQLARVDLREMAIAEKPDRAAIEKKMKEISDLQYQTRLNMVDMLFSAREILTPEQQKMMWDRLMDGGQRIRIREHIRQGGGGMGGGWGAMDDPGDDAPGFSDDMVPIEEGGQ